MPAAASRAEAGATADGRVEALRSLVEREYTALVGRVAAIQSKVAAGLRRGELLDRAAEVVHEAYRRAREAIDRFDPSRSAVAWLIGIAVNVIREQTRLRLSRPTPGSDIDADGGKALLERLCAAPADPAARLDAERVLSGLPPDSRRLLELRYWEGLEGDELARAVGAPSAGAAKVRLCRALQALRERYGEAGGEVTT
jgi:RNA polymerase sigma factor (sigma-70 family)